MQTSGSEAGFIQLFIGALTVRLIQQTETTQPAVFQLYEDKNKQ